MSNMSATLCLRSTICLTGGISLVWASPGDAACARDWTADHRLCSPTNFFHGLRVEGVLYLFRSWISLARNRTILRTRADGIGLSIGNWTEPFPCLYGDSSFLKASIPEGIG